MVPRWKMNLNLSWVMEGNYLLQGVDSCITREEYVRESEIFENPVIKQDDAFIVRVIIEVV